MKRILFFLFLFPAFQQNLAQDAFFKDALKSNRERLYRNIVKNTITANLSTPLNDSTEELWQDAFWAMEVINYRSPWTDNKIMVAMDSIQNSTLSFQRSILELIYTNYPLQYDSQVIDLLERSQDPKIFAMCGAYLLMSNKQYYQNKSVSDRIVSKYKSDPGNPLLLELLYQLQFFNHKRPLTKLEKFLAKDYLPGNVLIISFQRKDRNYPGLVIVRDTSGNFIKDDDGNYFSVPQLARSISNLPGYLTNGNTPEGIFRMDGFDHSKSNFIGPTTNIQLTMPFEFKASHFYKDSTLADSIWNVDAYKNLLPENFRNYFPMMQSYYAGKAGRTEIIAHGTTVDPAYYKEKPYYPLTPTQGCLCSKEIWSEATGKLLESDQQKLANAVAKAGGPDGYAIVINIDDKQEPVSINDIIPFLKLAIQK